MREVVVLDASLALAWLLPDERGDAAMELLARAGEDAELQLAVPPIFWWKVVNVLAVAAQRSRISTEWAQGALQALQGLGVQEYSVGPATTLAAAVAHRMSAYDAQYLVLASDLSAGLWTLDRRLAQAALEWRVAVEPS